MALLQMQDVTVTMGGQALLQGVNLSVEPGERLCVTGRNGAGKSTLLALLGGQLPPDSGRVLRATDVIGQMPQDVPHTWSGTVFNLVADVLGEEGKALAAAHALGSSTEPRQADPGEADMTHSLLSEGAGWERYGELLGIIRHLELDPDADFSTLSGGTRRRVALARALACSDDLILDEPTNHLDLTTIVWLEEFLLRKARTLVFVSHDRSFVRRLATRLVEVDRGGLHNYACGYDQYLARREERLETEERHFALFDKKLAQEEAWIRQGIKARRTRNMGRVRALRDMRRERAARRERQGVVSMLAQEAERSGKLVIEANDIAFAHPGGRPLFSNFSTVIQRGDRLGIIGANGSGKTTLIRVLLGELNQASGTVRHGTNLHVSYFDQLRESLDPDATVMDSVAEGNDVVTVGGNTRHVAGYLQDFLFTPDRLRLPVKVLSGGERNRLLLAKLFTRPSNVLVLDEPTNDLDVETLELLEELLADYSGTVLLVSHDRTFLDNLVTGTLALEGDGQVHEYVGAYTDWLRQRLVPEAAEPKRAAPRSRPEPKRRLTWKEERELEKLEADLAVLPDRIAALEAEQADLAKTLEDPDLFNRSPETFARVTTRLAAIEEEQIVLLEAWEAMEARREELRSVG